MISILMLVGFSVGKPTKGVRDGECVGRTEGSIVVGGSVATTVGTTVGSTLLITYFVGLALGSCPRETTSFVGDVDGD